MPSVRTDQGLPQHSNPFDTGLTRLYIITPLPNLDESKVRIIPLSRPRLTVKVMPIARPDQSPVSAPSFIRPRPYYSSNHYTPSLGRSKSTHNPPTMTLSPRQSHQAEPCLSLDQIEAESRHTALFGPSLTVRRTTIPNWSLAFEHSDHTSHDTSNMSGENDSGSHAAERNEAHIGGAATTSSAASQPWPPHPAQRAVVARSPALEHSDLTLHDTSNMSGENDLGSPAAERNEAPAGGAAVSSVVAASRSSVETGSFDLSNIFANMSGKHDSGSLAGERPLSAMISRAALRPRSRNRLSTRPNLVGFGLLVVALGLLPVRRAIASFLCKQVRQRTMSKYGSLSNLSTVLEQTVTAYPPHGLSSIDGGRRDDRVEDVFPDSDDENGMIPPVQTTPPPEPAPRLPRFECARHLSSRFQIQRAFPDSDHEDSITPPVQTTPPPEPAPPSHNPEPTWSSATSTARSMPRRAQESWPKRRPAEWKAPNDELVTGYKRGTPTHTYPGYPPVTPPAPSVVPAPPSDSHQTMPSHRINRLRRAQLLEGSVQLPRRAQESWPKRRPAEWKAPNDELVMGYKRRTPVHYYPGYPPVTPPAPSIVPARLTNTPSDSHQTMVSSPSSPWCCLDARKRAGQSVALLNGKHQTTSSSWATREGLHTTIQYTLGQSSDYQERDSSTLLSWISTCDPPYSICRASTAIQYTLGQSSDYGYPPVTPPAPPVSSLPSGDNSTERKKKDADYIVIDSDSEDEYEIITQEDTPKTEDNNPLVTESYFFVAPEEPVRQTVIRHNDKEHAEGDRAHISGVSRLVVSPPDTASRGISDQLARSV
ncbi:hypothetical protein F5Y18DRAFT_429473 [Xylariaceae sp. FL1019]|nr:hypothetical protein F5Y18DRAFT_429473 [Xylariaceae sp. FL1019]